MRMLIKWNDNLNRSVDKEEQGYERASGEDWFVIRYYFPASAYSLCD